MMRIVQLITTMDVLGGAQMHVFELTKELVLKGHQVTVMAGGTGTLTDELENDDIPYIPLQRLTVPIHPMEDIMAYFEVRKMIKKLKPDLLAIHSSKAGIIGRLVGRSLRIPTVFTAHSWSFAGETSHLKRWLFTLIEKIIGRITQGVITVSSYDYNLAIKYGILPREKMRMIHNGIRDHPSRRIKQTARSRIRLLMVARFAEPKDHILLLQSLKKVDSKGWTLTLIGDGPLYHKTKSFVQENQLTEQVFFLQERRDVTARLENADVFILTSKSEGLPISIIEAMREGLPIIASDVGGVNELIDDQDNGLLVPKGDELQLIKALNTMLNSDLIRRKLGSAAREKYEQQFTFTDMFLHTENYYMDITGMQETSGKRGEQA